MDVITKEKIVNLKIHMNAYIKNIEVVNVLHLHDFSIPIDGAPFKHLILTGKNGSGKTTLLKALYNTISKSMGYTHDGSGNNAKIMAQREGEVKINLGISILEAPSIRCYFEARRGLNPHKPQLTIVPPKISHTGQNHHVDRLLDYLFGLYINQLSEERKRNIDKSSKIAKWFAHFEDALRSCFEDSTMEFEFDLDKRDYLVKQSGREPYNFSQLSDGFSAILSIVAEVIMRMGTDKYIVYDMAGIVFIDEVDIHLHLSLQKNVMPLLTSFFPNIQFIVTTHSPFVLTSLDNAVIYDLEHNIQINESIKGASYEAVVESYFKVDEFNDDIKKKIREYRTLVEANKDKDFNRIIYLKTDIEDKIKIPWLSKVIAGEFAELEIIRRAKMHK